VNLRITHYASRFTHHESRSTKEVLPLLSLRRRIESLTPKQIVLLVFVIAFLIRLAFLATKPHAFTHQLQAGDEPLYHGLAVNLLKGEGYTFEGEPRSYPPPFYAVSIAIVYSLVGAAPPAARIANALLGSLLCALIAWWAFLLWGKRGSLAAGLFASLYYPFVQLPTYLMTENLYLPLFVAATMGTWLSGQVGISNPHHSNLWARPIWAGIFWGLSALTREIAKPVAILSALWLAVRYRWKQALVLCIAMLLVGLPWSVRNRLVFAPHETRAETITTLTFDLPFFVRVMPGGLLYMSFGPPGSEPRILGHWNWGSDVKRPEYPDWLPTHMRDQWLKAQAWDYIRSNPFEAAIARVPRKLANLLVPFYGTASLPNKLLTSLFYLALLLLSVPSLIKAWKAKDHRERTFAELVLLVALFTVTFHAIFYGVVRYRYPIDALLLVAVGGTACVVRKEESEK
jgi:4-amino-4-deoxy-L-arabinose transferase-like glycosyltransferase